MREQGRNKDAGAVRVLVVDDDELVLESIVAALGRMGYEPLRARSGDEALAQVAAQSPQVVLMDIRMPGMSGIDAARRMRDEHDIPVIFLSAYSEREMVREATQGGALGYLVIPVQFEQLAPSIEAALARAADIRALRSREKGLSLALSGERAISIAVGMLMERGRLTSDEAFEMLRRHARSSQRKVADVSVELVRASDAINQVLRTGDKTR